MFSNIIELKYDARLAEAMAKFKTRLEVNKKTA